MVSCMTGVFPAHLKRRKYWRLVHIQALKELRALYGR